MFLNKCYFYCTLSRQAEFPNYPKYCLSEIGSALFISDNRGSTVQEDGQSVRGGVVKFEFYPYVAVVGQTGVSARAAVVGCEIEE